MKHILDITIFLKVNSNTENRFDSHFLRLLALNGTS